MALISKATIQEVNNRLDAIAVVGDFVRLEKKGGRWWGRCPFHGGGQEKTPSFKVDPDLKMYHCFGCGKGGSVISFVMEMEKLSYPEAIKVLAKKSGVEIIYEEGPSEENENDNSLREELFELYRRTTVTFQHFLLEKPEGKNALNYLKERGVNSQMIDTFKLGYAPQDRNFLHKFLRQKGYSDDFLEKSGLFSSRNKSFPMFSGRLMFPITDRQGRIVAFGGRALPGILQSDGKEPPKYINSPETEIYKKGQTLYAIDLAKSEMRTTKTVYLAEGYMDVLALHQGGVVNSVAPLGTAFTDEQAKWLSRWVEKVVLIFDNDEAGQKAAYKAIITCRKNALSCSIASLEEGLKTETGGENAANIKDPADILQKFDAEILKKVLKFTINDFEYLIVRGNSQYAAKGNINRAAEFMFPYLEALDSEIDRSDSITRIADIYKIERSAVQKDYSHWKSTGTKDFSERQDDGIKPKLHVSRNEELTLLANVAVNTELYPDFRAAVEIKDIDDLAAKELFIALEECFKHGQSGIDALLSRIDDEALRNFVASLGTSGEFKSEMEGISARDPRRFMEDGIKRVRIKILKKRITEINAQMRESERSSQDLNIDELLADKKIIDSQIRKLEGR
ncbi:MAG: DNA primase [Treponema sp.]|jgi:DNA primase|nr:DNA primase [Treponema sp.]